MQGRLLSWFDGRSGLGILIGDF